MFYQSKPCFLVAMFLMDQFVLTISLEGHQVTFLAKYVTFCPLDSNEMSFKFRIFVPCFRMMKYVLAFCCRRSYHDHLCKIMFNSNECFQSRIYSKFA